MTPKERLQQAKNLLDLNLISKEEYDTIKEEVLKNLGLLQGGASQQNTPSQEHVDREKKRHENYLTLTKDIWNAANSASGTTNSPFPSNHPELGTSAFDIWIKKIFCQKGEEVLNVHLPILSRRFSSLILPDFKLNPTASFNLAKTHRAMNTWFQEINKIMEQQNEGFDVELPRKFFNPICKECGDPYEYDVDGYGVYCCRYCSLAEERNKGVIQYIHNGCLYTL